MRFFLFFLSVSLGCRHGIVIFIFLFLKRSKKIKKLQKKKNIMLAGCDWGIRSDLSITCMINGNFGHVSAGVLFSKVMYQQKRC